jgi:hypothetical protein
LNGVSVFKFFFHCCWWFAVARPLTNATD